MRIAFWGNFGALNLGNECTLAACIANLRARLPNAEMVSICRGPEDVAARHGIGGTLISARADTAAARRYPKPVRVLRLLWLEAREWLRAWRYAGTLDALLITGSGILSDEDEGILGLPYELLKWSAVARLRGRKVCYVSVGAESISRPASRRLIRWALRLAHYRSYRDQNSAELLARCGVPSGRDAVRPDLAFSLAVPPAAQAMLAAARAPQARARVAIGVYNYRGRGQADAASAEQYRGYLDRLCALVTWLLGRGYPVRIVIGDFRYDDDVRLDLRAELERRHALPREPSMYVDDAASSFEEVMVQLASVDFVIASRYHNVLLGLYLGRPAISLSYEAKHEALMASAGLGDYCQSIGTVDVERLFEQFQRLEAYAPRARESIAAMVVASGASLADQYRLLAALIPGKSH